MFLLIRLTIYVVMRIYIRIIMLNHQLKLLIQIHKKIYKFKQILHNKPNLQKE